MGKDTVNLITGREGALKKATGCYMIVRSIKSAHMRTKFHYRFLFSKS